MRRLTETKDYKKLRLKLPPMGKEALQVAAEAAIELAKKRDTVVVFDISQPYSYYTDVASGERRYACPSCKIMDITKSTRFCVHCNVTIEHKI